MSHHLSLVFTSAASGRDDAFNEWYLTNHIPEVLRNIPGFMSASRYQLSPTQRQGAAAGQRSPWRYLTLYELDTDDVAESHRVTEEFKAANGFTSDGGTIAKGHAAWVYSPIGPKWTEADIDLQQKQPLGVGRHLVLALTNPQPGRESDFDTWYEIHVREVVAHFPGLTTGRLYRSGDDQRIGMTPRWANLALYELEADDVDEYHRLDQLVRERGELTPHNGALRTDFAVWVFSEMAPRITRDQVLATA